jgi:hypothetical protein
LFQTRGRSKLRYGGVLPSLRYMSNRDEMRSKLLWLTEAAAQSCHRLKGYNVTVGSTARRKEVRELLLEVRLRKHEQTKSNVLRYICHATKTLFQHLKSPFKFIILRSRPRLISKPSIPNVKAKIRILSHTGIPHQGLSISLPSLEHDSIIIPVKFFCEISIMSGKSVEAVNDRGCGRELRHGLRRRRRWWILRLRWITRFRWITTLR